MALATINTWDGILEGCLGKDCPTPCCTTRHVKWTDGKVHEYFSMVNEEEQKRIMQTWVQVRFEKFESVTSTNIETFDIETEVLIALKGCLWVHGCSIPEAKPSTCKSYPYNPVLDDGSGLRQPPFDLMWFPAIVEIVSDEENTKRMLETRKSAWYNDNNKYIEELYFTLSMLWASKPERNFIKDSVYMEAIL